MVKIKIDFQPLHDKITSNFKENVMNTKNKLGIFFKHVILTLFIQEWTVYQHSSEAKLNTNIE